MDRPAWGAGGGSSGSGGRAGRRPSRPDRARSIRPPPPPPRVERRARELVDVEPPLVVEVQAVAELGELLAHRAGAAPVVLGRRPEELPEARGEGDVVELVPVGRVLAPHDAAPERALVVVGAGGGGAA